MEKRIWHYTTAIHLQKILQSGELRPDEKTAARGERPTIWFSTNTNCERSALKMWRGDNGESRGMTFTDMSENIGAVRIEVSAADAPLNLDQHRAASGMTDLAHRSLLKAARKMGANPREWRAAFDPIPAERFLLIEVWAGHRWEKVDNSAPFLQSDEAGEATPQAAS
jgi:hypothetical protein